MNLEIHTPELEQRLQRQIQCRHFHDVDELLTKALDALDEKAPLPGNAHDERTGSDLIAALQSSPYRELEIEPERFRLPVRDVVL